MATEEQLQHDALLRFGWSARPAAGQRLTISNRTVTAISFFLAKKGSPSGNVYFRIRKVSDDSVMGSKLWGQASALPAEGAGAWVEAILDSATYVNEEVRITCEGATGSSNLTAIDIGYQTTDVKADEYLSYGIPGGTWVNSTAADCAYRYTFAEGGSATPVITTQACTYVIAQSATGNGNLQSLGTSAVTQHGHCWNTSTDPTTSNSKTENGATANLGPFQSSITALIPGTKYYVRAYAVNTSGTAYGANVEIAGDVTTIGKRYWWVEGKEFHYYDQWGAERKVEGIPDASGLPWWFYY